MPEFWAECEICNRSFYCGRSGVTDGKVHHCPVCGSPASKITATDPGAESGGDARRAR